jgi:hypothetical protein
MLLIPINNKYQYDEALFGSAFSWFRKRWGIIQTTAIYEVCVVIGRQSSQIS